MVNPAWSVLLGYPRGDLEGRPFLDFVHPDDLSATIAAVRDLGNGQEVLQFINRYRAGDGTYRWIEWRAVPEGELVYASARDITPRVVVEQALRESQRKLEDLIAVVSDWVWETDAERRYVSCSEGVRRVLGYDPEEVIGKTPWDFMVPADVEVLLPGAEADREQDRGCSGVVNRNLRRDGEVVVLQTSCVPVIGATGDLVGYRGVNTDVTAAVRADEALRESVVRLDTLWRISDTFAAPGDLSAALRTVVHDIAEVLASSIMMAVIFGPGLEGGQIISTHRAQDSRYEALFARGSGAHFSLFSEIARGGTPVVINDLESGPMPSAMLAEARKLGFSRVMVVPLVLNAEIIGTLIITRSFGSSKFIEQEVEFAQAAAGSIAAAIVHARLRQEENMLTAAQVRDHLARELHDAVTQSVYSASLIAEALPAILQRAPDEALNGLAQLRRLVKSALAELRILLYELRPATLAGVDLSQLLERLADSLAGQTEVEVDVRVDPGVEDALPSEVKVALYRIAQEAFNNIAKHARAAHVTARVEHDNEGAVVLAVRDDGVGLKRRAGNAGGHLGLDIMSERAHEIGATFNVAHAEPTGTIITVRWSTVGVETAPGEQGGDR
jgi:PAS domain S-box-containing protein